MIYFSLGRLCWRSSPLFEDIKTLRLLLDVFSDVLSHLEINISKTKTMIFNH